MTIEKIRQSVVFNQIAESADGLVRFYYYKRLHRSDGAEKLVSATAIVKDENLLRQLKAVKNGVEIEIETATYWNEKGMPTYLIGFSHKKSQPETSTANPIIKTAVIGDLSKAKFASSRKTSNDDEVRFV